MMRYFGKIFFPTIDRDQQRRQMNTLIATAMVVGFCAAVVGVGLYLLNRR